MLPQIILIVLSAIGFGIHLVSFVIEDKNGCGYMAAMLTVPAILHTLLYWGGFYDCFLN